ncbi:hypothetical protein BDW59DRAFT_175983 [Aspergillus cavernicola]|uniref:Rhodopsin domain-containing protein n=1 Tax=Aspergillus cavernicola TaxID=176166 RepID=A0ABR4HKL4_9EURO
MLVIRETGVTANFTIAAVGITLCTSYLMMRIYTKARLMRRFWLDDVFIIFACIFSLATQSIILCRPRLLILYYILLHHLTTLWKYTIYTLASLITSYSIVLVLSLIFACSPIHKDCINRNAVYLATAITNTVSDLVLIAIPVPIVLKLRLPVLQRVGVICDLGFGGVALMSIIHLATLMPQVTGLIEANLIILCACLPYLWQFLRHHAPRVICEPILAAEGGEGWGWGGGLQWELIGGIYS